MQPVALLCSEPLRPRMAGIGIRYFEMAKRLPAMGVPVRLLSPFRSEAERLEVQEDLGNATAVTYAGGAVADVLSGCSAVVAQGQLANEVIHQGQTLPLVIDLYDPWLVENLHYFDSLGLDPYRNDHATWMLQLSAGDVFLCSSSEQRLFYSGLLVATGRVNPKSVAQDPALERLLLEVPFGVPRGLSTAEGSTATSQAAQSLSSDSSTDMSSQTVLPPREQGEKRILFGGLYEWYDPWPLLEAVASAAASGARWKLLVVHNPNAGTPQTLVERVRKWTQDRGVEDQLVLLDWLPADRRYDLLREVDVLAATHRDSLETQLSLRTRFLDALAVGCPILVTEGGAISRQLTEYGAGWVVPEADPAAIEAALRQIFEDDTERQRRSSAAQTLSESYAWERVLEPLAEYLRDPWIDPTKSEFAQRLESLAPADSLGFRLKRKLQSWSRRRSSG